MSVIVIFTRSSILDSRGKYRRTVEDVTLV